MTGMHHDCHIKLFDYSHTAAPDYYAEHCHTVILLRCLEGREIELPNLALTPGHYLERYLVEYQEVDLATRPALAQHHQLYAQEPEKALAFVGTKLERLLLEHPGIYVEIRDNVMLAFRPDQELETPEAIAQMLAFAEAAGGSHSA